MRQLLAILMLCIMVFSHGSMGAAVPHENAPDAGHGQSGSRLVVHHVDEEHDDHAVAPDNDDAGKAADHAVHAHIIGDLTRQTGALAPVPLFDRLRLSTVTAAFRPSRGIAPLLEPPSA